MLYVKKSKIPGAGKGLFTDAPIKKDEYIIEYKGEEVTWAEVMKRADNGRGGYAFYVTAKKCIDAFDYPKALARYANDARGMTRGEGLRNNSVYAIKKKTPYIQATRNIKAGEEIFVWYGPDYWEEHLEEVKAFKKRVRSEAAKRAWETRKHVASKRIAKKSKNKSKTSTKSFPIVKRKQLEMA